MGVPKLWEIVKKTVEEHNFLDFAVNEGFKGGGPECQPTIIGVDTSLPVQLVFVFDGPARPEIKRGSRVLTSGHWLTAQFQVLIRMFGYHLYTAPGEAEAELGRLNEIGTIDIVMTTDVDPLLFGARALMILLNKKKDKENMTLYMADNIFINPNVSLTCGGLLLIALLAGGDYHKGVPRCGVGLAHAIARRTLGNLLLRETMRNPQMDSEFIAFLASWRIALASEFATDLQGYLGSKQRAIAMAITAAGTSFPDVNVLSAYVHPITLWSGNFSPPAYQSWGLACPDLENIARFCQLQFRWNAKEISKMFTKSLYSGIALQSLLKPYDLHVLLEAHVNSGVSSDDNFPRSSILQVLTMKAGTVASAKLYRVEISTGTLSLRVKAGLKNPVTFPAATVMRIWSPVLVIDYALPDLVSRSKVLAKLNASKSRLKIQGHLKSVASHPKPHTWAPSLPLAAAGLSRVSRCEENIIDLTSD